MLGPVSTGAALTSCLTKLLRAAIHIHSCHDQRKYDYADAAGTCLWLWWAAWAARSMPSLTSQNLNYREVLARPCYPESTLCTKPSEALALFVQVEKTPAGTRRSCRLAEQLRSSRWVRLKRSWAFRERRLLLGANSGLKSWST